MQSDFKHLSLTLREILKKRTTTQTTTNKQQNNNSHHKNKQNQKQTKKSHHTNNEPCRNSTVDYKNTKLLLRLQIEHVFDKTGEKNELFAFIVKS